MSVDERTTEADGINITDGVAGLLAAVAGAAGILSLVWYPGRVGPAAMLVALIACVLATAQRRFAAAALTLVTVCWLAGMIIAVLTERPVF